MKNLEYKIEIAAGKEKVWDTMLQLPTYEEWVGESWPGSSYEGNWKQGETIKFVSPSGEGTQAILDEVKPHESIKATHNAVLLKDRTIDRDSEEAKSWVGTKEWYTFTEKSGKTEVRVQISTNPAWEKMFDEGWPKALNKLKEITERK